ncbi:MAG: PEP-CTERM sorting domain-containing protein [Microcystis panniformis Mp_MB_F_20051200_S9]|uniref:PEP-CTERM sorting domain-containing protein n=1 Tax=Microcystis panniformis Mp_MB_F_20051200_S9 TaxID=2486223 RepID=A0A552QA83_9CHRO|nr:MAG: PEP-CTERM sorting domain-containing protein [Microcystis panniformis Mp_MB_F_20080800_S26D]TRV46583.1 MAG: PEP-CTERM sorting domain-containing protein [Microcystis panniformis Mp_GB_SS_20050300_S99D]TRV53610.1 MAG: PEP-CTERM sorting domain-containing protein [Microcystis panniformis Mp_GB_SS_20050300_S99]TRV62713.1 MAG: PEP-CTERM sorting domain-containing protein [Microcystis panniformis Mp_MB_F_20080800_S26]TRV66089.1 MAG: PEP-CTERM sorting domain-containing protein [Microcystis pannif
MKKFLTILTPLTLMGLAGVAPAQAAIVAGWNQFNASTATYPKAADTVGANITSTGLDTAGITRLSGPSFSLGDSPNGWNTGSTVNSSQYVQFAVQPSAGFQVDFTNLQLNARHDETALNLVLRSSVDGFTSNLGTQVNLTTSFNTYSFDLSSLAPQTSPVQFRLYGLNALGPFVDFYGGNSASVAGGGFVALNGDITPTPTVSTPEPSGIVSLIIVGALGVASLRRWG